MVWLLNVSTSHKSTTLGCVSWADQQHVSTSHSPLWQVSNGAPLSCPDPPGSSSAVLAAAAPVLAEHQLQQHCWPAAQHHRRACAEAQAEQSGQARCVLPSTERTCMYCRKLVQPAACVDALQALPRNGLHVAVYFAAPHDSLLVPCMRCLSLARLLSSTIMTHQDHSTDWGCVLLTTHL